MVSRVRVRPSRYGADYTAADCLHKSRNTKRGRLVSPDLSVTLLKAILGEALRFILAQEAFEEALVALFVVQDVYEHILRDGVYPSVSSTMRV